jgi:diacylglycerol kinase (ATP)
MSVSSVNPKDAVDKLQKSIQSPILSSDLSEPVTQTKRTLAWKTAGNLLTSFRYAWAGVHYAFVTQRNFRIHAVMGIIALSLGTILQLQAVEMAAIAIVAGLVLTLELINTAIESVVDLTVKQTYHELAKIAKDCAAGAVLVSAFASLLVASSLLLPPLWFKIQLLIK